MSTDEPGGTPPRSAIDDHYARSDLGDQILEALAAAGHDLDDLSRDDIASIDEFHIRGREATRELADVAGLTPGDAVLDVGCGVGGPARTLAAEFDCDVVGIDVVEEYCRAAALLGERVGLVDRVEFRVADAVNLPFRSDRFDVVWLQHVLMNVAAKPRALAEANRVLRPGGTIALYEICAGPGGDPYFPAPWAPDESINFLTTPRALRTAVESAGFVTDHWSDVSEASLEWFRSVVDSMASRSPEAPPALGLNLLMGADTPEKAANVVRSLEEDRIAVVRGGFTSAD